ncbi:MAG: asparagine synthase (glutamine-hydrolyzing) [Candidatus Roizmanbacteria bacterium]|nr:asparagine synthase (glutamine-hydrolyzing) [Candidatus Roizmanbacteria bacterium]
MCGIAGIQGTKNDELLKVFSKEMEHRGPDGDGFYYGDTVSLINRRLAIIDIKGGDQPIYNEDKSIVVVYNGEMYNYRELRLELEKAGHIFSTHSDTEVIVHGYEQWGDTCFDRFNGMFGIALYDIKKDRLLLARDHFGIKPLYFTVTDENKPFAFASEIKPLLASNFVAVSPNDRIIYRYLRYRIHDDGRETFFTGINRLLPGEMMIIEKGKRELKSYTKLQEELLTLSKKEHNTDLTDKNIQDFKELLVDSISRRLISEVPVGTCLSGGLDSSTVVAVVNQLLLKKAGDSASVGSVQKTFSAVFPGSTNDEESYIEALLETSKKIQDFKIHPDSKTFLTDLKTFVRTQEEPTISTGPYAQYKVMEKVHKEVVVVLDGQGSDEMMAGYLPYYFVYLKQLMAKKDYMNVLQEVFTGRDVFMKFLMQKLSTKKTINTKKLLNAEFADKQKKETFTVENNNLKKRLLQDIFSNSLQSLLRYEDKNAMKFSVEGRVPFLDFRLLKFIFSLSDKAIIWNGWNKYILRKATEDILPSVINKRRNKIGFTTPEHEWFLKEHKAIREYFTSESFISKTYLNQAELVMEFDGYVRGETDDITKLVTDTLTKLTDKKGKWFIVVTEKIVATAQGRAYFIWDIHPSFFAQFLSRFVSRVPYGIGLGSPWTMQLAIQEVGLPRILCATVVSMLTRPFGVRGMFYRIAGRSAAGIDGPTEYSLYPANVSAKLLPKDPQKVCNLLTDAVNKADCLGIVIIDANDIGRNILGNSTGIDDKMVAEIFADNPMGQTDEQTPLAIVFI